MPTDATPEDMHVKRLLPVDAELAFKAIEEIKGTEPSPSLSIDYLRKFLTAQNNVLIVASNGDDPTGYLIAYLLDRVDGDQQMVCLYEIEASKSHRRTGVARAMIDTLKDLCGQLGATKAWVITNRSNSAAVGLYESTGAHAEPNGDELMFVWDSEHWKP